MSVKSILSNLEKNFAWSFLGVILAVIFFMVTLYFALFFEKKAKLQFDIVSETNVLEVREQLGKLSILFDNENISQKGMNLRIITLKITNTGEIDLLQSHYDVTEPWGFNVENARLIEVNPLESNSDYLKSKINPSIHPPDSVIFEKVIIEREKFITMKVLVLHSMSQTPSIVPFGKIAGIDQIELTKSYLDSSEDSFWKQLIKGSILLHLARVVVYSICFLIIFVLVQIGYIDPLEKRRAREHLKLKSERRIALIEKYQRENGKGYSFVDSMLADEFVKNGFRPFDHLRFLLEVSDGKLDLSELKGIGLSSEFAEKIMASGMMKRIDRNRVSIGDDFIQKVIRFHGYLSQHLPDYD